MLLMWIFDIIMALIYNINDISILEVVKSTFFLYKDFVCRIAICVLIKGTYLLLVEIVINFLINH